MICELLM